MFTMNDECVMFSEAIPRAYLVRTLNRGWWAQMEEVFENVGVGTRILVRRDRLYHAPIQGDVYHDYITTRVEYPTFYGHWTHQTVVYPVNHISPYSFDVDGYHHRNELLEQLSSDPFSLDPPHDPMMVVAPPPPAEAPPSLSSLALLRFSSSPSPSSSTT